MASRVKAPAVRPAGERRELLTLLQVWDELGISESTWYEWRDRGDIPKTIKLPNRQIRVDRVDLNAWLDGRTVDPEAA
jgi:predicted DNA-binding transcriptional regulator AlpA